MLIIRSNFWLVGFQVNIFQLTGKKMVKILAIRSKYLFLNVKIG